MKFRENNHAFFAYPYPHYKINANKKLNHYKKKLRLKDTKNQNKS